MSSKSGDKKDICMGKSQTDMCPFSCWKAREGNSECTGKFHQSSETKRKKKQDQKVFWSLAQAQSYQRH